MKMLISNESYAILKERGHVVPRCKKNNIIYHFKVGKEYTVVCEESKDTLKVVCSQNNPTNLNINK